MGIVPLPFSSLTVGDIGGASTAAFSPIKRSTRSAAVTGWHERRLRVSGDSSPSSESSFADATTRVGEGDRATWER